MIVFGAFRAETLLEIKRVLLGLTGSTSGTAGPLFHMCDNNGYISGLKSVHDNGKEDRRPVIIYTSNK